MAEMGTDPDLESNRFRGGLGVLVFGSGADSESIFTDSTHLCYVLCSQARWKRDKEHYGHRHHRATIPLMEAVQKRHH